jgi:hypothetical protein
LEGLELEIAELERKKGEISHSVNAAGGDYEALQRLTEALEAVETELEKAMLRWLELSEKA